MRTSCSIDEPLRATGALERMRLAGLMAALAQANCITDQTIIAGKQTGGGAFHWSDPPLPARDDALLDALVAAAGLEADDERVQAEIVATAIAERSATLRASDLRRVARMRGLVESEVLRLQGPDRRETFAVKRYPLPSPHNLPTHQRIDGDLLLRAIGVLD